MEPRPDHIILQYARIIIARRLGKARKMPEPSNSIEHVHFAVWRRRWTEQIEGNGDSGQAAKKELEPGFEFEHEGSKEAQNIENTGRIGEVCVFTRT